MEKSTKKYFDLAYDLLGHWLTPTKKELEVRYTLYPEECVLEESNGLTYLLFCYPLVTKQNIELLEEGILLVYDNDTVIADLAFMHGSMNAIMKSQDVYDEITTDSDWSFLEYYTLCNMMFPDEPYPYYQCNTNEDFPGETCFFTNAYVTKAYRQQGIFSNMLQLTKEQVLRNEKGNTTYYSIFSLDPDIACYGPDTPKEPYIYSMKDEKDRMRNKHILERFGYVSIKLEETSPQEDEDGTKLWFALCKETEKIVEIQPM